MACKKFFEKFQKGPAKPPFLYARQSRRLMRAYVTGYVCLWNRRIDEWLIRTNYLGHQNFKSVEKKNSVRLSVCPFVRLSVAIMGFP